MSCLRRLEGNCNYDHIDVFDGPYHSSPLIARLCHGASNTFTSSSNFMSIRFVSDGSVTRRGFEANYYSSPSNDSTRKSQARGGGSDILPLLSRPVVVGQDTRVALVCADRDQGQWVWGLWLPTNESKGQSWRTGSVLASLRPAEMEQKV